MTQIKIQTRDLVLRRRKGLTQEEVARALGVSNQAVSKWESAQCCPDIGLLPEIASLFEVSVDELLGYKPAGGLSELCLTLKEYFTSLPTNAAFEQAYRIAALLHEAASTDGYKKYIPWRERDYSVEDIAEWGLSICSEPDGCTVRSQNSICFTSSDGYHAPDNIQLTKLSHRLSKLSNQKLLRTLFALHNLTHDDFDRYVGVDEIASAARLHADEVEELIGSLSLTVKEEDGEIVYRLDGSECYLPSLLLMLSGE